MLSFTWAEKQREDWMALEQNKPFCFWVTREQWQKTVKAQCTFYMVAVGWSITDVTMLALFWIMKANLIHTWQPCLKSHWRGQELDGYTMSKRYFTLQKWSFCTGKQEVQWKYITTEKTRAGPLTLHQIFRLGYSTFFSDDEKYINRKNYVTPEILLA